MAYTAENWPIAAKMAFGTKTIDGTPITQAGPKVWAKQLAQTAALGYKHIDPTDVWIPFWEFSDKQAAEFHSVVTDSGLAISSMSMGRRSMVDTKNGELHMDIARRFIDLAQEWNVPIVNVGFMQDITPAQEKALWFWLEQGHQDDPALRDLALERIAVLGDYAKAAKLELSLEMYEDTYLGTADDAVSFITDLNHDAVGLNPDIGNFVRLHRPVENYMDAYEKVLPYSNFWHIKNYLRDEDPVTGSYHSAPVPLETGVIDYRTVIQRALQLGFKGPFMAEHYGSDWLGVGARNAAYIRQVLSTAF